MRIAPVNQQSFKGLWEVKDRNFNFSGVTSVWDVSYIYHPFKDEFVSSKEETLKAQVPETHDRVDEEKFSRNFYFTKFEMGDKLDFTEDEFSLDKKKVLDSLDGHYAESTEEIPAEKFYNDDDTEKILRENEEYCKKLEKKDPGCCKRAYDALMKGD